MVGSSCCPWTMYFSTKQNSRQTPQFHALLGAHPSFLHLDEAELDFQLTTSPECFPFPFQLFYDQFLYLHLTVNKTATPFKQLYYQPIMQSLSATGYNLFTLISSKKSTLHLSLPLTTQTRSTQHMTACLSPTPAQPQLAPHKNDT